jgi:DNA-binding GntR family transcriptional regulator
MNKPATRMEEAYKNIKRMLLMDQLEVGQKLRYQEIAKKLGMSQTPVMMALVRLEDEGLVKSRTNRGFYVPLIDLEEAKQLYDMRIMLEIPLLKKTIRHITDEQIDELRKLMKAHSILVEGSYSRERLWADAKFHLALAACSRHWVALKTLRQIFDLLYLRYRPVKVNQQRIEATAREHRVFFEALGDRNLKQAVSLLKKHIEHSRDIALKSLPPSDEPQEPIFKLLEE